ncbi:baseplate protein [Neisseria sp. N95_16]|uniref:Baseplate protein n=1 Tax=Neisseria brasiliensis TaxID=2666100 RepID=A0A7X2GWC9_9NEIS|nr:MULTISPECIES: baseplate J/gp47 family protein [Neisseria]MRN37205.1 baseplate protein [Neisseria brasiliensis]PJO10077.1 baseplate protein [Neisseria sp. N95_16]
MAEIDLTRLPAPDAIEQLDFETIFARKKKQLIELCPDSIKPAIEKTLELESEPLTIDLQQQAYSEMLIRHRINEATKAGFLALATGTDLDHIGAGRGIARKIIQSADETQTPPRPEIKESDAEYRKRIQMHHEKLAAAGPRAAYIAHSLDVDDVADANPVRAAAGIVCVYIKSYSNDGIPSAALLSKVKNYLSAEDRRPLCDTVEVKAARAKKITIEYETEFEDGPDKALVKEQQRRDLEEVLADNAGLSASLARSKIIGALDTIGTKRINLRQPAADIVCAADEFIQVEFIRDREVVNE